MIDTTGRLVVQVSDLLGQAGPILSLVALVVAAVASAYSAYTRTTLSTLKENNAALDQRVGILERAVNFEQSDKARIVAEAKAEQARITAERDVAIAERDTIAKVVTGEAHLVAIEELVSNHHTAAEGWWEKITDELTGIRAAVEVTG